ncbi:MAG: hypothetical protein JSV59_00485 [Flavobacteriaceae bacterium]|nr:MAG: hypothetical protein JSV59_00485 [Flavobacteriaceae bacterium]
MALKTNPESPQKQDSIWESETDHHAHSSEWLGAVVRYLLLFGRKDFDAIFVKKERKKNYVIGTVIKLALFFLFIYLVFRFVE